MIRRIIAATEDYIFRPYPLFVPTQLSMLSLCQSKVAVPSLLHNMYIVRLVLVLHIQTLFAPGA